MKKIILLTALVFSLQPAFAADEPKTVTDVPVEIVESKPAAEAAAPAAPAPVSAEAKKSAPVPKLSVFVNGTTQSEALKGWPLIVKVTVEHPDPDAIDAKPITLSSKKGDWTKLLRIEVVDKEGSIYLWPFELAPLVKREPKIILDAKNSAFLAFLLSPTESKRLESGEYSLRVVIKAKKPDGTRFTVAKSHDAALKVSDHPPTLTAEQESAKAKLEALYYALKGEKAQAEKIVSTQPVFAGAPELVSTAPYASAQPVYSYVPQSAYAPAASSGQSSGAGEILGILSSFGFGSLDSDYSNFDPSFIAGVAAVPEVEAGSWEDWSSEAGMDTGIMESIVETSQEPEPVIVPAQPSNEAELSPEPSAAAGGGSVPTDPAEPEQPADRHQTTPEHSGFPGPDITITAEWSEADQDVDLSVSSYWFDQSGEPGLTGRPNVVDVEAGPGKEVFRPWDLSGMNEEKTLLVGAYVNPKGVEPYAKAHVKITYSIPGRPDQTFQVDLDEEKNENFWIAFQVDCVTGNITPIQKYDTSFTNYVTSSGSASAGEANDASQAESSDDAVEPEPTQPETVETETQTTASETVEPEPSSDAVEQSPEPAQTETPVSEPETTQAETAEPESQAATSEGAQTEPQPTPANRALSTTPSQIASPVNPGYTGPNIVFSMTSSSKNSELVVTQGGWENKRSVRWDASLGKYEYSPWKDAAVWAAEPFFVAVQLKADSTRWVEDNVTLTLQVPGRDAYTKSATLSNRYGKNCWVVYKVHPADGSIQEEFNAFDVTPSAWSERLQLQNQQPDGPVLPRDPSRMPRTRGYAGPDTIISVIRAGQPLFLRVENQSGEQKNDPLTHPASFRPWDLADASNDTGYWIAVAMDTTARSSSDPFIAIFEYGTAGSQSKRIYQSMSASHRRTCWIVAKMDPGSGMFQLINEFDESIAAYRARTGN